MLRRRSWNQIVTCAGIWLLTFGNRYMLIATAESISLYLFLFFFSLSFSHSHTLRLWTLYNTVINHIVPLVKKKHLLFSLFSSHHLLSPHDPTVAQSRLWLLRFLQVWHSMTCSYCPLQNIYTITISPFWIFLRGYSLLFYTCYMNGIVLT